MLKDLEDHIICAGLDDMKQWAEVITQVYMQELQFRQNNYKTLCTFLLQDSEKYVERLLELFRRFSDSVKQAFLDDPRFLTARDKAYKMVRV